MKSYDVIIVGAGPGGGQCARALATEGHRVLLLEKAKDFQVNNYSSAGAPLEILKQFQLPEAIVAASWNQMALASSFERHVWKAPKRLGVVFDFADLRAFLTEEALRNGADIAMGTRYLRHEVQGGQMRVYTSEGTFETALLVDASGAERSVLHPALPPKQMVATGIEYLVTVPEVIWEQYRHTLSFYMGRKWMPQGYAWIFPMAQNQLKVGIGRYFMHERLVPTESSFNGYLEHLIAECLDNQVLHIDDKHGKTLRYSYGRHDPHFSEHVLALGDAVSTLNPLGCEGIRHAMWSGHLAAKYIPNYLKGDAKALKNYAKEMQRHYRLKWWLAEKMMNRIYREPSDEKIHQILQAFKSLSTDQMMHLGFDYRLTECLKLLWQLTFKI